MWNKVAGNHPAQVAKRGVDDSIDERRTPEDLFAALNDQFRFTLDAAASEKNAHVSRFFSKENSGLDQSWKGERVWCNPPFSGVPAWVAKAWSEMECNGCSLVVMLLPANRTEQPWWHEHVEPYRTNSLRGGYGSPSGSFAVAQSSFFQTERRAAIHHSAAVS